MEPLVSYLLFAYKQEAFIEEALRSALMQAYPRIELVVTDDASPDRTPEIIERVLADYTGPMSVRLIRNSRNVGLTAAINAAVAASTSDIIVVAAGDDISHPQRTRTLVNAFAASDTVMAIYSNSQVIDERGQVERVFCPDEPKPMRLDSFFDPMTALHGATAAYRRTVFDTFGPLGDRLFSEDRILSLRAAILGDIRYLDEVLVQYRVHGGNIWLGAGRRTIEDFDAWRAKVLSEQQGLVGFFRSRIQDLDKALSLGGENATMLRRLRAATVKFLVQAEAGSRMLDGAGLARKAALTIRVFAGGVDRRYAKKWMSLHFFTRRLFEKQRRQAVRR